PGPIEKAAIDGPWELLSDEAAPTVEVPRAASAAPTPSAPADAGQPDALGELLTQLGTVDFTHVRHLALEPGVQFNVVRRLGPARSPSSTSSGFRLSVVFMAAQPDGLAGLAVDQEEAAICKATGGIGLDLAIEDSGNLARLGDIVARVPCD